MQGLRKFAGSAAIYVVSSAVASGVPFLLMPFLTRSLSPAEYGTVGLFLLCINFFSHFTGLGLNGAVSVRYFDNSINFSAFISSCLTVMAVAAVCSAVLILLLSAVLIDLTELPVGWLQFALVCAVSNSAIQLRLSIWQAQRKPVLFGAMRIAQALLDIFLSIALVLFLLWGWQGRAIGAGSAFVALGIISLLLIWRDGLTSKTPSWALIKSALRFGIPLLPHLVGGFLLLMVDRLLVAKLVSIEAAGIYMVAVQIGLVLNLIITAVNRTFSPWLMKTLSLKDPARDRKIVAVTYLYVLALFIIAAVCSVAAHFLLPALVGKDFLQSAPLIPYFLFGTAFTGAYFMVTNYVFFTGRTEFVSFSTIIIGVANVLISYQLILAYGIMGAAYSFLISQAALFFATWAMSARVLPMPWSNPDFRAIFVNFKKQKS